MKTLLITGASGLLGQYLCEYFATSFNVIGTEHSTFGNKISGVLVENIDLTQQNETTALIEKYNPDYIIHTVALTSVDECEASPEKAELINVTTTKNILHALKGRKARFIFISTDHLFDGKESNYTEESPTVPLNVYAKTKLEAEQKALAYPNSLALRTNFYGGHTSKKPSFSSWIYKELSAGKKITMFTDVYFTPISICGLAENLKLLIDSPLKGLYNLVGAERVSKYDFALKLAEIFSLNKELIQSSKVESAQLKAERPKDMSLSIHKISKEFPSFVHEKIEQGLLKIKQQNLI